MALVSYLLLVLQIISFNLQVNDLLHLELRPSLGPLGPELRDSTYDNFNSITKNTKSSFLGMCTIIFSRNIKASVFNQIWSTIVEPRSKTKHLAVHYLLWKCAICTIRLHTFTVNYVHSSGWFCLVAPLTLFLGTFYLWPLYVYKWLNDQKSSELGTSPQGGVLVFMFFVMMLRKLHCDANLHINNCQKLFLKSSPSSSADDDNWKTPIFLPNESLRNAKFRFQKQKVK